MVTKLTVASHVGPSALTFVQSKVHQFTVVAIPQFPQEGRTGKHIDAFSLAKQPFCWQEIIKLRVGFRLHFFTSTDEHNAYCMRRTAGMSPLELFLLNVESEDTVAPCVKLA